MEFTHSRSHVPWLRIKTVALAAAFVGCFLSTTGYGALPDRSLLPPDLLVPIADIVRAEIAKRHIHGTIVLIGQGDRTVYRRAFGLRRLGPGSSQMTVDTIFDLASLTKVVAATTALM